jgi:2-keto-4-pentenoate hydratase
MRIPQATREALHGAFRRRRILPETPYSDAGESGSDSPVESGGNDGSESVSVQAALEAIWNGHRRGVHHPPEWQGKLSINDAYAVQLGLLDRYVESGERHAGWKVGLTAKAMQEQQRVHEPVFGFLLESGRRPSGAIFDFDALIQPGFENELCLTMGVSLTGPGVTLGQARAAVASVQPALEIVERRGDFTADLHLALADNAQQRAFVTGEPIPLGDLDLAQVTVDVLVNGARQDRARGDAVLGTPIASIAWLANKLAEYGRRLDAGQRIMSGSFTRQYALVRGDRVEARFDPVGAVSATFR